MPVCGLISASVLGNVLDWLQRAAHNLITWIEDLVGAIPTTGWVFLALAAAAVGWVVASLRASVRLGPIEVAPLVHDQLTESDPKPPLEALTAAFRERLDEIGFPPPPAVPQGAPQANLVQAVEASPIPHSAFIAKLLEVLPSPPRPAQYKVSATLTGLEDPTNAQATPCGVSFWLQPMGAGASLLRTVNRCPQHEQALHQAASMIYLKIAGASPDVFPLWARWGSEAALDEYLRGCERREGGDHAVAVALLTAAANTSPFNVLAPLELGNLEEQQALNAGAGLGEVRLQVRALRRYLGAANLWPSVVEARYRTSVLAATLATNCDNLEDGEKPQLAEWLPGVDDVPGFLRRLASRESSAALQLLRPWYTLVREQRLRNPFEPKGHDRRALKHTIRISRHCVRLRAINAVPTLEYPREILFRRVAVHVVHLLFGKGNLSWQARYNAACFDALLLDGGHVGVDRVEKVRDRALHNLDLAIRESDGKLSFAWAALDPDFAWFHEPRQ